MLQDVLEELISFPSEKKCHIVLLTDTYTGRNWLFVTKFSHAIPFGELLQFPFDYLGVFLYAKRPIKSVPAGDRAISFREKEIEIFMKFLL